MPTPFTLAGPEGGLLSTSSVTYGPDIAPESDLRLLGSLEGRRVLELGCGAGANTVAMASAGARVIALDESPVQIELARRACGDHGVRAEVRDGPLAELAFVRADSIDVCVSVAALADVADVDRVFRQVHRVLRPDAPLVLSLPHPALTLVAPRSDTGGRATRAYWDPRRTVADLFASLQRANFRVDALLEPEPLPSAHRSTFWDERFEWAPPVVIIRARKEGI